MALLLNSTSVALWYDIVHEAEAACTIALKEELEAYLVFLLARFANKPHIVSQVIASEFLAGLSCNPHQRELAMQEVGDKCLLFSGLFPQMAAKRLVKISYFVNLGQSAYSVISKKNSDLYNMLSTQFVQLMDILQSIRCYTKEVSELLPMEAYELWNDVGSQRALRSLKQYTSGAPVLINSENYHQ